VDTLLSDVYVALHHHFFFLNSFDREIIHHRERGWGR
jgi:hypothetical protein